MHPQGFDIVFDVFFIFALKYHTVSMIEGCRNSILITSTLTTLFLLFFLLFLTFNFLHRLLTSYTVIVTSCFELYW